MTDTISGFSRRSSLKARESIQVSALPPVSSSSTRRPRSQALRGSERPADLGTLALLTGWAKTQTRSEEHTSELQSLMRISYAIFCLKKKKNKSSKKTNVITRRTSKRLHKQRHYNSRHRIS